MMPKSMLQKLEILADAAKYDASCASSGDAKRNAKSGGIGSTTGAGICHAYTPDGRWAPSFTRACTVNDLPSTATVIVPGVSVIEFA